MNLFDQSTPIDALGTGSLTGSVGSAFTQGTDVFGLRIPNWVFIAVGAVLVAVIIVILVLLGQRARRKKRAGKPGGAPGPVFREPQAAAQARPAPERAVPAAQPAPQAQPVSQAQPVPQPVPQPQAPAAQERPAPAEPVMQPRKPFEAEAQPEPVPQRIPMAEAVPVQEEYTRYAYHEEQTGARSPEQGWGEGDETAVGLPVTFRITYQDATWEETHPLEDRITLGRLDCTVNLDPSDKTVSRKHCELLLQGGSVYVRNLSGSVQGTVLNGQRIADQPEGGVRSERRSARYVGMEPVNSGDELTLGRHTIRVLF